MQHIYSLRKDELFDEYGTLYIGYGIDALNLENRIVISVPDIFLDESEAIRFADTCNALKLNIVHLYDVIEDAIG